MFFLHTPTPPPSTPSSVCSIPRLLAIAGWLVVSASIQAGEIPFSASQSLASGTANLGMTFGDLDGDGDLDAVIVDTDAGTVSRLDNAAGDASSWVSSPIASGFTGARAAALGDIDLDGDLDAVAVAEVADTVAWFENTAGNGSAWTRHDIDTAFDGGVDVALADIDQDGALDVIAAGAEGDVVALWLNPRANSAWTRIQALGSFDARSVVPADFDSDGDLDFLSAAFASSSVSFAVNTSGDGSTWTSQAVSTAQAGSRDAAVADVDGDGDLDVLQAAETAGTYTWVENTGGSWTEHTVATGEPGPMAVAAVDMDQDGDIDLLGADGDGSVSWWQSDNGGALWTKRTISAAAEGSAPVDRDIKALDLDDDGDLDVVATGADGSTVWWQNQTSHRSTAFGAEQSITTTLDGAMGLRPVDLDGDGDIDLAGTAWFDDRILWWENSLGDGTVWVEHGIDDNRTMAREVFPVDMDRDGDQDLLATVLGQDTVSWWENTAGDASAWTEHLVDTAFVGARSVFPVDMDADGDSDIIGTALYGHTLAWFENLGDGLTWTEHHIDTLHEVGWVYGADLDSDGDIDVAAAAAGESNRVSWWRNTGGDGSSWSDEQVLGTDLDEANVVHISDLNGDGLLDIMSATIYGDRIVWWQNPGGAGTWTEHLVDGNYEGPYSVISADLDSDGDEDVAVASLFGNRVSWFENLNGNAMSWEEHTVGLDITWGRSIRAADFDGDGDLDLAASGSNSDEVSWWRQQGGQYSLPTFDAVASSTPNEGSANLTLLRIDALHLGRAGDSDLEIDSLRLRFETPVGIPLTASELNGAAAAIRLHRDNGDGVFSAVSDPVVVALNPPFAPDPNGELAFAFVGGEASAQVAHGNDATFFITVDLQPTASQTLPNGLRAVHLAESSTVEMSDTGIELAIEPQTPFTSMEIVPQSASVLVATPQSLDFGQRGIGEGPSAAATLTIENQGTASFSVGSIRILGLGSSNFRIVSDSGETVLGTGTVRTLSVVFDPISVGNKSAQLRMLPVGGVGQSITVPLAGVGTNALFTDGFESGNVSAWSSSLP